MMKVLVKLYMLLLCGWLCVLAGCSEAPITGRKQLHLVPESQMTAMAATEYKDFLTQNNVLSSGEQAEMVRRVGRRIQQAVQTHCKMQGTCEQLADYEWEFNLVEDKSVNAWAMPGGKVVVYTGLLPVAEDETGLAVVMGHEIAHAIARHGNERMSQSLLVEMGSVALSVAMKNSPARTKELFVQSYGAGTKYGVLLPYSRTHETEADHLGLIYMAMAGYDPHAAVAFWQRMGAKKEGKSSPEFLSTHPSDEKRIRQIQEFMPEAMQYYQSTTM